VKRGFEAEREGTTRGAEEVTDADDDETDE
jgi:hypothetical protein